MTTPQGITTAVDPEVMREALEQARDLINNNLSQTTVVKSVTARLDAALARLGIEGREALQWIADQVDCEGVRASDLCLVAKNALEREPMEDKHAVSVHDFVTSYEVRGDGFDHTLTTDERTLVEDAIESYLALTPAVAPDGARDKLSELC